MSISYNPAIKMGCGKKIIELCIYLFYLLRKILHFMLNIMY